MEAHNILFAFTLTMIAGLATGIGSLMAFMSKKFNHKFLSRLSASQRSYDICIPRRDFC
jgi:zinc transporter ZupT